MASQKTSSKTTSKSAQKPPQDDMMTSTPQNGKQAPMLQLGGLWVNESQSGTKYMTGYLGNLKIMVFRNNFKTEDKHPDYVMYLTEKQRDTEKSDEGDKDDIPF